VSTLAPHPSASGLASKLLATHPPQVYALTRVIPAFTTTTSVASTSESIPATVLSFWLRTTFSSTQRILCTLRTMATRSPTATISVVPRTRLPLALSPPFPTTTHCLQPAPSSPMSPPVPVLSSPSERQCILCIPSPRVGLARAGPGIGIKHGHLTIDTPGCEQKSASFQLPNPIKGENLTSSMAWVQHQLIDERTLRSGPN